MTEAYDSRLAVAGAGHPVVLVPGMDGTGLLFHRQIPLIARSRRAVSYALRDSATTMEALVADLAGIVDTVAPGNGRATVIGESFGGALAMSFALAEPDRVDALIVLNSFPFFSPQRRLQVAIHGLRAMPWGAMGMIRRLTAFRMHSRHTHRAELERFMQLTARATKTGYINRLRILTRYDIREQLADLRPPVLFLAAEEDHLVPSVQQATYMGERVPGAVVRVLAGHGHICLIAPDVDLGAILDEWRSGVAH